MGQTLREKIAEARKAKEERYREFQVLLEEALEAGRKAASEVNGPPERTGVVRIRMEDAKASFAYFVRQEHGDTWMRHRRLGNYLPVSFPDLNLDKALAYAGAVREVLHRKGIEVKIEIQRVGSPDDDLGQ